jgi:predicted SAM-dependent methyltransferase
MTTLKQNDYLYVGCGSHRLAGFTHVDIDYAKNFKKGISIKPPEILCDITKEIPCKDNSVKLIFSRETLEHLKYRELINHLIECHRILKKDGILRICVPDLDLMIKKFLAKKESIEKARQNWELDKDFPINNYSQLFVARTMYHDHNYNHNFETMKACLDLVGFENIEKCSAGKLKFKNINNNILEEISVAEKESEEHLLYITAIKMRRNTKCSKFNLKEKNNLLNTILIKLFNLNIKPFNNRRTHFPQKVFFKEKIFKIKKIIGL